MCFFICIDDSVDDGMHPVVNIFFREKSFDNLADDSDA